MKLSFKLASLMALLCSYPAICAAQQNEPDATGVVIPTPGAPAFGAYIDYNSDEYLISGWSKNDYADYPQITNLPTVYLTSTETIDFVDKTETYYSANIVIVDKHGTMKQRNEATTFRGRGNATWRNGTDKKPWRLKFPEKTGLLKEWDMENSVEINNFADAKSWTLLSNPFDKSMIRNAVTNELGKIVGLPFCPAYKFVDLVLNGEYFGTYQISDHMEVAKNRVWVNSKTDWFLEICGYIYREEPDFDAGCHINVKNPDDDPTVLPLMQAYMQNVYTAVSNKSGLKDYIDLQSLADFMIGMDMTSNYDGAKANGYLYKGTGETDKLKFGPLWDLDLGYGNVGGWASASDVDKKHFWQIQAGYYENFYKNIYESPEFQMVFYPRWKAVYAKGIGSLLNGKVDEIYNNVKTSAALNYTKGGHGTQKWNMSGNNMGLSYSGNDIATNYKQACEDIKTFITSHVAWLNEQYAADYRTITGLDPETAVEPEPENPGDDDPEAGPCGEPGALVDNADGTYTFTGSAASFKEGTVITITTSANATLTNYITEGITWNSIKTITLTTEDVNALAANKYTFHITASGGEVIAVNVKAPAAQTGLSAGTPTNYSTVYTYIGNQSCMAEGAKFSILLEGSNPYYKAYISNENGPLWYAWGSGAGPKSYSYTVNADQAKALEDNKYRLTISVYDGTCSSASFVGKSSGTSEESAPTYALTLTASVGGSVTGAGTYEENTTVIIKAIPAEGYKFVKWSDDNTLAVRSVTIKNDLALEATFIAEEDYVEPKPHAQLTNLPTIYLTATVGDEWSAASLEVFDKDNKLFQGVEWTNAEVEVQYQGSGNKEKDSYRLKFGSKTKLLASGKFKQWVLLANDDDPSLMRNALAKKMGDALGLPFTPGYQFVDLYFNEEYMGTYQVTDRIKVEAGRAMVTGGNKELDWHVRFNDKSEFDEDQPDYYIAGTENMPYIIPKNPDPKDDVTTWEASLNNEMRTYFSGIFAKTNGHFSAFADNVDHQQLVQWYIAQEVLGVYKGFSSIEAYRSITETAADQKLHIGVLWDSEKSLGNPGEAEAIDMSDLETADSYNGLMTNYAAYGMMKDLFKDLWSQPWFARAVNNLWKVKQEALLSCLKATAKELKGILEDSQVKNLEKWKGSLEGRESYDNAVAEISNYLDKRFAYLTKKFDSLASQALPDIETMLNIILGYTAEDSEAYDMNADGKVTVEDLVILINATMAEQ